jgi:hypothetical protein
MNSGAIPKARTDDENWMVHSMMNQTLKKKLNLGAAGLIIAAVSIVMVMAMCLATRPRDIFDAVRKGSLHSINHFIVRGVNVNTTNNVADTPLHLTKTRQVAEFLISKGAQINPRNGLGQTPLHLAAVNGRPEVAAMLIAHGADINVPDIGGATPLDLALIGDERIPDKNHDAVIALLIAKGGRAIRCADKLYNFYSKICVR